MSLTTHKSDIQGNSSPQNNNSSSPPLSSSSSSSSSSAATAGTDMALTTTGNLSKGDKELKGKKVREIILEKKDLNIKISNKLYISR
jgi:hypothetical protein